MPNLFSKPIDGRALGRWAFKHRDRLIVALAVALRVYEYGRNRSLWLDEASLRYNLADQPILPLFRPLTNAQLAPAGFVAVERFVGGLFGGSGYSLRAIPFAAGIAAVFLFWRVAKLVLEPRSVTPALALFMLGYDPIYYSSELKQYSSDLALALLILWIALLASIALTKRRANALTMLAIATPWFSHPAIFSIAGIGVGLLVNSAQGRRWNEVKILLAIAFAGALSFGGSHRASTLMLGNPGAMDTFWSLRFLRLPPRSWDDWQALGNQIVDILTNPLDLISSAVPWWSTIFVLSGYATGLTVLLRHRPWFLVLTVMPILPAALASAFRLYPFHGRLVLFLVPAFDLLLIAGLQDIIGRMGKRSPTIGRIVFGLILLHPLISTATLMIESSDRLFSPIGDLHPSPFPVRR